MTNERVTYEGSSKYAGWSVGSETGRTPAEIAEDLYRRGWYYATLTVDGLIVGEVVAEKPGKPRVWWGETGETAEGRRTKIGPTS